MKIAINGIGAVGGFGSGVSELETALTAGQTTPGTASVRDADAPVFTADTSALFEFVKKRSLRRIDHFSRMALLGACLAIEDASINENERKTIGVAIASGYGASRTTFSFLDSALDAGDHCSSPTLFSNSVHNAAAAHISILLGIEGPSLTVSQFEMSFASAILSACCWINEGKVDTVLVGGVDEYCEVLGYCQQKFSGRKKEEESPGSIEPMDLDRQTAIAGEGAVFLVLSRPEEGMPAYGYIKNVEIGTTENGKPDVQNNTLMFIGADGNRRCSSKYAEFINNGTQTASFAPVYGSLPVGPGFDIAAAALSMKRGRTFVSPNPPEESAFNIITRETELGDKDICCLKLGNEEYSLVTLGK